MVSRPPSSSARPPARRAVAAGKPATSSGKPPPPEKNRPLPRRRASKPPSWFRRNPELTTLGGILAVLAVVLLGPMLFWPAHWRLPGSRPPVVLDTPPAPLPNAGGGLRLPHRLPEAPPTAYPPRSPGMAGMAGMAAGQEPGAATGDSGMAGSGMGGDGMGGSGMGGNGMAGQGETDGASPLPVPPVPQARPQNQGRVVVIIDDMGIDRKRSARAAALPGPLTLAWLPYAPNLPQQTRAARAAGHEMMVHLPMEPDGDDDPGPNALRLGNSGEENLRRLQIHLAAFEGYVGVNNHMGSRFTADPAALKPVMAELKRRSLIWVDSRTTPNSAGPALARAAGVPFLGRDVFLDHDSSAMAVRISLSRLEQLARQRGLAVAIGHPHDNTLNALADWLPSLTLRGLRLISVSAAIPLRAVEESAAPSAPVSPAQSGPSSPPSPAVSGGGFVLQGENP